MNSKLLPGSFKVHKYASYGGMLLCMLMISVSSFAQDEELITVSGVVRSSEENQSLPGVNVVIKGTTTGTVTDVDGRYTLHADKGATLVFSFVGYQNQEVNVAGRTTIDISMSADVMNLQEVVVVGYGTERKIDLTGSVATVHAKDFERTPVLSASDALAARAPGLNITAGSGAPGDNSEFLIRGVRSVNGTSAPIFVVDGVITESINNIAPSTIESVSVLKDASATSIYGARAANGVIVITTKRGQGTTEPQISFNTFVGVQKQSNLRLNLLNADEFINIYSEAYENAGIARPWTDEQAAEYDGINTDWLGEMTRTGVLQSYDLSVSGSSGKSNYFLSAGYQDNKGMVIGTDYKRYSFMVNTDHRIGDRIKFGNSLNVFSSNRNGNSDYYRLAAVKVPLTRAFEDDGTYGIIRNTTLEHMFENPIWMARENVNNDQTRGLRGSLYLTLDLIDGLKFTTRGSLEWSNGFDNRFIPGVPAGRGWQGSPLNSVFKTRSETAHTVTDFLLDYEKQFGENHKLKVLAGYSIEEWQKEELEAERYNTPNNELRFIHAGDPTTMQNDDGFEDWAFLSTFGRVNYIFKDKYLVTASVRRDGTSRLAAGHRYGVFPAASVAWRLSEEDFMNDVAAINDLKLRASFGKVGNALSVDMYGTVPVLEQWYYAANQQIAQGFTNTAAINSDLSWESTVKKDIGLDASLFNANVYTTVDYFIEDTHDLLFEQDIAPSAGYDDDPFINAGKVRNTGLEFLVGYRKVVNDWNLDFNVNFTRVRNEVVDLEGRDLSSDGTIEGFPVESEFGYKSNGIIRDQQTLDQNPYLEDYGKSIGDIWILDINSYGDNGNLTGVPDGKIDGADRTIIGNKYPSFYYGFMSTVGYKAFSLQIQLQGVQGVDRDIRGGNHNVFHYFNQWAMNHDRSILDRFNAELNPDGAWPRVDVSDQGKNRELSDFWLRDASFLRIRNINLNYDFTSAIASKVGMKSLGMYVSVQNLYTFTKFNGPEVDTTEDPLTGIPQPRVWSLGLKAVF